MLDRAPTRAIQTSARRTQSSKPHGLLVIVSLGREMALRGDDFIGISLADW
jgi:hypothetical protein